MSLQVEKMEKNMAKLTIEVAAEDLEKAMQNAYQKAKGRISIPGFRKGKAPRKMIEQMYGKGVFLEDAVNALIPEHYSKALAECELEIVSQPTIDITQAEPGKAFIFTAEVAVKPEVTLGDYKGVEVPKTEITVTDEDVEADEDDDESSFDLPDVDDDDSEEDYDEDLDDLDSFDIDDDSDGSEVASPPDPPVPVSQSISKGTKPQIKKDSNDYFADAILGVNDKVIKIPGWFRNKNTQRK